MAQPRSLRVRLLRWYAKHRRDLPWRRTPNPYRIWISEIMLQQTRVAAVIPYYERFLERFPTVNALAEAEEKEVLALWSGLGYYSRARNLHRAARLISQLGRFPSDYDSIRALPGVGDYTAAAIASIAFGVPRAVVDGNVLRVVARLTNDSGDIGAAPVSRRLAEFAGALLDRKHPGEFNQAIMELGATVCLPRQPNCPRCPLARDCLARQVGTTAHVPVKLGRKPAIAVEKTVLVIRRGDSVLLRVRPPDASQLAGFWELPGLDDTPGAEITGELGSFRHSITNTNYRFTVLGANVRRAPRGLQWVTRTALARIPLTTTARKALRLRGDAKPSADVTPVTGK